MKLEMVQVDAFAKEVFQGNSAAVIILEDWLPGSLLQNIALENNLSETVYVKKEGNRFAIRWFTPTVEVSLCGHATLAAAYVLFKDALVNTETVEFVSQSGELSVQQEGDLLKLDFPATPAKRRPSMPGLEKALGVVPEDILQSRDTLVVLKDQQQVAALTPDFAQLAQLDTFGVIATAPGEDCDFVSRFFAPAQGINEDPVTGSAHCTLIPYWSQRLNQTVLHAKQISQRGGELFCEDMGERVSIAGYCCEFLRGTLTVPE